MFTLQKVTQTTVISEETGEPVLRLTEYADKAERAEVRRGDDWRLIDITPEESLAYAEAKGRGPDSFDPAEASVPNDTDNAPTEVAS